MAIPGLFRLLERGSKQILLFLFCSQQMSILHRIAQKDTWEAFYECKMSDGHMSMEELRELKRFIERERYRSLVEKLLTGDSFSYPVKMEISKIGKQKKRVVYTFRRDENLILKLLTHLLVRKYDHLFSPNLYSFRVNSGVKRAIRRITACPDIDRYYSYK